MMIAKSPKSVETFNGIQAFHPKTRGAWRRWLQKHHAKEKSVWLIMYHKASNVGSIYYEEAIEEALCFGWIDSKAVKRNKESRYQYFCPRKPKSRWSKINRERVQRMINEGLMMPAGQAVIDLAKKSGTWDALVGVENSVMPDDLRKRFERNKRAFENFQAFPPSAQRVMLEWIMIAKRPDTRMKRIEETVQKAARNLKAYP